jgi:hypothetical protein
MRRIFAYIIGVGAVAAAGCQDSLQRGVIRQLPDPLVSTYPARPAPAPPPLMAIPPVPAPQPTRGAPGWVPPGGVNARWTCIVIHHSATPFGGARKFDNDHRAKGWDELGYHFVIGNGTDTPNGAIEVGSRWTKQKHGAHCKTPDNFYNEHGIGICLVGNFDRQTPTAAQMASLAKLVSFLMSECSIPLGRVYGHGQCKPTECPGRNFSMASLKQRLSAVSASDMR